MSTSIKNEKPSRYLPGVEESDSGQGKPTRIKKTLFKIGNSGCRSKPAVSLGGLILQGGFE
jgi:hypothetical protein